VFGEGGVIENERVVRGAAEAVVAVLEPEEPGECQPAVIARQRRHALCAPFIDERALGLRVGVSGCRNGAGARLQREHDQERGDGAQDRFASAGHAASLRYGRWRP